MPSNEPSPRPWRVEKAADECRFWIVRNPDGVSIGMTWLEDDAALIVDAVNHIEETKRLSIKLYDPIKRAEARCDKLLAAMKAIEDLCKVLDRTDLWEAREEWLDEAIYYIREEARAAIKENEEC